MTDNLLEVPDDHETIQILDEQTYLFMQDNAPWYKAIEILEFLKEYYIPVMMWPLQSSDLNSLDNFWVDFETCFYKLFIELFHHSLKGLQVRYRYSEIL